MRKAVLKGPNAGFQAWEAGGWVDLELLAFFEGSEGESADQAFNIQSGFRIHYGFALLKLKSAPAGIKGHILVAYKTVCFYRGDGVVVDNKVVLQLQFDHGEETFRIESDVPHDTDFHSSDHDIAAFIQSPYVRKAGFYDHGIRSEDTATANLYSEIKDGQDAYENEEANGEFGSFLIHATDDWEESFGLRKPSSSEGGD